MSDIQITEAAAGRISQLITEEGNPNLKLRVYVTGGGCSGMQYGFGFESNTKEGDQTFSAAPLNNPTQTIQVLVDPISMMYLEGSTIDYEKTLRGAHFKVNNPNAQTTCGCGSSFSIDED